MLEDREENLAFVHLIAGVGARRLYVFQAAHERRKRKRLLICMRRSRYQSNLSSLVAFRHRTILQPTCSFRLAIPLNLRHNKCLS